MANTRIKPEDFETLTVAKYQRYLEKDLAKLSRKSGYKDYVCIYNYKGGRIKSKTTVLIFAAMDDEQWGPILTKAVENGTRYSSGVCKVVEVDDLDNDGDDDITIAIKTASGGMTKMKTVQIINEEMFPDDLDYEAVLMKELGEESDEELIAKRKTKNSGDSLADETTEGDLGNFSNTDEDPLIDELKQLMGIALENKTTDELYKAFLAGMNEVKTLTETNDVGSKTVVDAALQLDINLENKIEQIQLVLNVGKDWAKNAQDKMETSSNRQLWEQKMNKIGPLIKQFRALKKRLDKMEAAVEEKFALDGYIEEAIDHYNEFYHRLSKFKSLPVGEQQMELLELDEEVDKWLNKLNESSDNVAESNLHARFIALAGLVDEAEKANSQEVIKLYGAIRKEEQKLDAIPPEDFVEQIEQIRKLTEMVEEFKRQTLVVEEEVD